MTTKVYIKNKTQKKNPNSEDKIFLCYEATTPPWDEKEVYAVEDEFNRFWFCHESDIELSKSSVHNFAEKVKEEYKPKNKASHQRRLHNPLIVQIVLGRAATKEELRKLLGQVEMRSSKGSI